MHTKFNQEILKSHLKTLIALPESEDSVFSFYINLERSPAGTIHAIRNELNQLRQLLDEEKRAQCLEAEAVVEHFVAKEAHPLTKSAAIFFRGGDKPFYLPIQFQLPMNDQIVIERMPHIVPLIEFKDRYDRYVVLISTEEEARIVEVVLGEVSKQQWIERPELRKRIGREWTREHYQNHRRGRTDKFIKEKIALLEQVFSQGGYGHLILTGSPKLVARVNANLPKHLQEKVIEAMNVVPKNDGTDIVMSTIHAFVDEELHESKQNLKRLEGIVLSDGPASIGIALCEQAFQQHQVDMLLITRDEDTIKQLENTALSELDVENEAAAMGRKQSTSLKNRREQILKMAIEQDVAIEFVPPGSFLDKFDGVGVLLRYKGSLPAQPEPTATYEEETKQRESASEFVH